MFLKRVLNIFLNTIRNLCCILFFSLVTFLCFIINYNNVILNPSFARKLKFVKLDMKSHEPTIINQAFNTPFCKIQYVNIKTKQDDESARYKAARYYFQIIFE